MRTSSSVGRGVGFRRLLRTGGLRFTFSISLLLSPAVLLGTPPWPPSVGLAGASSHSATATSLDVPATSAGDALDLDNSAAGWDVPYCEANGQGYKPCDGSGVVYSQPEVTTITTPSGDGRALQLGLVDGPPYPAVLYHRKLSDYPAAVAANAFELSLNFLYRPETTHNNQGGPSRVQAIEFSASDWRSDADGHFRVYDWELQYLNVLTDSTQSPIWRIWSGLPADGGYAWVETPVHADLSASNWYHLDLRGTIAPRPSPLGGFVTHYVSFGVDGVEYPLDQSFAAKEVRWQPEQAANVNVQLDGPAQIHTVEGYQVLLDGVSLTYFPTDPWTETCPYTPEEASRVFGGAPSAWALVPNFTNGWKYNADNQPPSVVPPLHNGRVLASTVADWTDGQQTFHEVGPGHITYATAATMWCLEWSDVSSGPFYPYIHNLWSRGILDGFSDGTFSPYAAADRATLARWLVRARGWPLAASGGPHFTDVPRADPNYPYVETAYAHGVLGGYADHTFRPYAAVTRGQMSKMVVNAFGWPLNTSGGPHFRDVDPTNPFYAQIETIYHLGLVGGYADGTYRWGNNNTRGQLSKVLSNALAP